MNTPTTLSPVHIYVDGEGKIKWIKDMPGQFFWIVDDGSAYAKYRKAIEQAKAEAVRVEDQAGIKRLICDHFYLPHEDKLSEGLSTLPITAQVTVKELENKCSKCAGLDPVFCDNCDGEGFVTTKTALVRVVEESELQPPIDKVKADETIEALQKRVAELENFIHKVYSSEECDLFYLSQEAKQLLQPTTTTEGGEKG